MKQYLDLLKAIKEKGTYKPAARENMPGSQSLFGYQFRHNLQDGFPLLTTKKMFWKGVVVELLWFLRGDTNIKYLVDNGVNIWNEDAYNYYKKVCKEYDAEHIKSGGLERWVAMEFDEFIDYIKSNKDLSSTIPGYKFGDCGYQYGKVWRNFGEVNTPSVTGPVYKVGIDQIKNLIENLIKTPESRRHIVTAWDPVHDKDLALTWCHAMFQMNCRPIGYLERQEIALKYGFYKKIDTIEQEGDYKKQSAPLNLEFIKKYLSEDEFNELTNNLEPRFKSEDLQDKCKIPKYYLDCHLNQRSADVVLGVPFNIASYALLTEILAKICNMIPGELIVSYGDVHIYDNHKDAVEEQLKREPAPLPRLNINTEFWNQNPDTQEITTDNFLESLTKNDFLKCLIEEDIQLSNYNPQPAIKAELSTGLKK